MTHLKYSEQHSQQFPKFPNESASKSHDSVIHKLIGSSPQISKIKELILMIRETRVNVLIQGESGTGKEVVAKILWEQENTSLPFVAVNCAAIPENLIESILFGHEKGSFTGATERQIGKFELAQNGIIFLDEIGAMNYNLQAKFLRVLEQREFERIGSSRVFKTNCQIISASNENLKTLIQNKKFREDLYYRLKVFEINLPPLRERFIDIPDLVESFLEEFSEKYKKLMFGISQETKHVLNQYTWPGNVRELKNCIEYAFILEKSKQIQCTSLPNDIRNLRFTQPLSKKDGTDFSYQKENFEKDLILSALKENKGVINKTYTKLGMSKPTLINKIRNYQIDVPRIKLESREGY